MVRLDSCYPDGSASLIILGTSVGISMDLWGEPIKLLELAKQWNKDESDLIAWLADKKMEACFWYDGVYISASAILKVKFGINHFKGWVIPDSNDLKTLQAKPKIKLRHFFKSSPSINSSQKLYPARKGTDEYSEQHFFMITVAELFITKSEIERMEFEDDDLVREKIRQSVADEPETKEPIGTIEPIKFLIEREPEQSAVGEEPNSSKILDLTHPWHSKHLSFAMSAWVALYGDRKGTPDQMKPSGGNIQLIIDWLNKNKPASLKLSPTAISNMATIINPDKSKGPCKTKSQPLDLSE